MTGYIDRFDRNTTSLQVLHNANVRGKIYMITGSSNGIGFETARWLCCHGAQVILCGSSTQTVANAVKRLQSLYADSQVYNITIDLGNLKDVERAAFQVIKNFKKLDGLILNAGISDSFNGAEVTKDGFEKVFQVNFLSQFYLTILLEILLKEGSRVVVVSSNFYKMSQLTRHNVSEDQIMNCGFFKVLPNSYATSKLLNVLHARELSRKLASKGVLVFSCHPGVTQTNIYSGRLFKLLYYIIFRKTKTLSQAAASVLYAVTSSDLINSSGLYIVDCCLSKPITPAAMDDVLAQEVWNIGIEMLKKAGCTLP